MSDAANIERCQAFVRYQLKPAEGAATHSQTKLAVTISRLAGSGAWMVSEKLADYLQRHAPAENVRWTVFDKELVDRILQDHNLPRTLAQFMPEDRVSAIGDAVEELLGLHPPSSSLVHQMTETILQLAELGNVILVGRGANVITASLPHVFHVRLIGSLERRIERVQARHRISREAARKFIRKEDAGRRRYLLRYLGKAIDDPLLYHLIINTDWVPVDRAAELIAQAMLRR